MTGYVAPQNTVGAGSSTGTPSASTSTQSSDSWRDNVAVSGGGGASVQVVYVGASGSAGQIYDGDFNSCNYVSLCGRLGFGLAAGGGGEGAAKIGQPLKNGWDSSYGYYYSGGSGIFGDYSVNVDKGMDGLEYSTNLGRLGWGGGGAAGYQWCGTLNYGCTK